MSELEINREFATASAWTFTILPIKELLDRYVGDGEGWIDPFAGKNSPAEITNDINEEMPADYHMEADEFCKMLDGKYDGILFDPPYSYRQISEHYQSLGLEASQKDTSYNFYRRAMNAAIPKLKQGAYAISFGWNTNGFGKSHGFKKEEILIVAHGMSHNDTLVTVERKVQDDLFNNDNDYE